eukprot:NODE_2483_length_1571_cov_54.064227_g2138_i0.p1 GENE.NODE_2483_length_1571_cov_54.064227_g2138_i0~~NODE_2483_length_1571_cov_54.064227_g2138_i0.p1  ORF type:complete len:390 (-),score=71.05 NODE_2483_length_1571_cov_54.064227_g2138_i0:345-1514(-)
MREGKVIQFDVTEDEVPGEIDNSQMRILPEDPTRGFPEYKGFFGEYGGYSCQPKVQEALDKVTSEYLGIKESPEFLDELQELQKRWVGRPTPVWVAEGLSKALGGALIVLKREDLAHTGSHKINHCLGEALVAKKLGKKKIVTETSGIHGVCLAAAAACLGVSCQIFVGSADWEAQQGNITRMKILGAEVTKVEDGKGTLKEASDKAFETFTHDPDTIFYAISTIAGPLPFPTMVKEFQAVVGQEARQQVLTLTGKLPNHVCGSVAGGSNALGIFQSFLGDEEVNLYAVEPEVLVDNSVILGAPGEGYMDCIGFLHEINYITVTQQEAAEAFVLLSRHDGIMPNWESCFALAHAISLAKQKSKEEVILVNLAGRAETNDVQKAWKYVQQ